MDLLHNFFVESGARMGKIRVYEATQNPVAREMVGYLIVRGGVHQEAYAKALSELSGVDITKLLPVPEISSTRFPHAKSFMDRGEPREVQDGPPEGGEVPDLNPAPPIYVPGVNAEDIAEIAKRL
jgi:Mn-containing catalase